MDGQTDRYSHEEVCNDLAALPSYLALDEGEDTGMVPGGFLALQVGPPCRAYR